MRDPFAAFADLMYRWRWVVIAVWFVLLNIAAPILAPGAATSLKGGGLILDNTESANADQILDSQFNLSSQKNLVVVFYSKDLTYSDLEFQNQVQGAAASIRLLKGVKAVTTYYDVQLPNLVSTDRHATLVPIVPSGDEASVEALLPKVRNAIATVSLQHYVVGNAAAAVDAQAAAEADLRRSELVTLPVIIIMLLIVFRTVVSALVPLILGVFSIGLTVSVLGILGPHTDISVFALNVGSLIGLGLAIDYSLIILTRYREELDDGHDPRRAVTIAMATGGRSVAYSAITVVLAMAAITIILSPIMVVRSISLAVLLVAIQAGLLAMTLLPAIMSVLKHRLDWLRVIPKPKEPKPGEQGIWYRFSHFIMRRPWVWLAVCLVLLLGIGSPVTAIAFGSPTPPGGTEVASGINLAKKEFAPGTLSPTYVIVKASQKDGVWQPDFLQGVRDLTNKIENDSRVHGVTSLSSALSNVPDSTYDALTKSTLGPSAQAVAPFVNLSGDDNTTVITVTSKYLDSNPTTTQLVVDLRNDIIPSVSKLSGFTVYVGGQTAVIYDYKNQLFSRFPYIAGAVAVVILIILMMFFQSLALPVKAVLMNLISIAATFGILSIVFQHGFLDTLLGFSSTDYITVITPGILYVILFALSTDYEVFMLSRVKEYFKHTGNNEEAVAAGLQHTAGIITAAGLILVLTFGSFVVSNTVVLKEIGLGLGLGVLLDSTIVRVIMVPSTMRLLGVRNWWMPGWLKRIVPEISEEGMREVANYTVVVGGAPVPAAAPAMAGAPAAAAPAFAAATMTMPSPAAAGVTMAMPSMAGAVAGSPPPPVTGQASLVASGEWNGVSVLKLSKDHSLRFGRMDSNEVRLRSLAVSRWHARIDYVGGQYRLTDLNSVNGVYVNGDRVPPRPGFYNLRPGDFVVIGGYPQVAFIFNVKK